jgi:hypothetical protein
MGEAMTGYESKRAAAQDKLNDDDDTQVYKDHGDALTIAYQSGYYDGKKRRIWVGLTDEEIDELHGSPMQFENSGELNWVRIIEAKLKEKNT